MISDRFDDEVLSDVLDGVADDQTTAAVLADHDARARLEQLRMVTELVATPPPPADPERRNSSIAAALAHAQTVPEVTSLTSLRERTRAARRVPTQWIAVAAAAVVVLLALPFLSQLRSDDVVDTAAETAAESADAGSSRSLEAGDDGNDSVDEADSADLVGDLTADSAELATTPADAAEEAGADMAAADSAGVDDATMTSTTVASTAEIPTVSDLDALAALIAAGEFTPEYSLTDPQVLSLVNPECLDAFAETVKMVALAVLAPPEAPERVLIVGFADDGTTTTLDGEDCGSVG